MKQGKFTQIHIIIGLLVLLAIGCNSSVIGPVVRGTRLTVDPAATQMSALYTQAAETIVPQITLQAGETAAAQLTQQAGGQFATETATPTATSPAGSEPATATPTSIPWQPTATKTSLCDRLQMSVDVTVSDGTVFLPGANFTKIWRLRNLGSCTWTKNYALVFISGERLQGATLVPLAAAVAPGEYIDVSVGLAAPQANGKYRGYWMLRNAAGHNFGYGEHADNAFWVEIRVNRGSGPFAFDFSYNMCLAAWQSSAGNLPCPGDQSGQRGFVLFTNSPALEDGRQENEQTLWTRPDANPGGWIVGVYPAYTVQTNDYFMADIGCLKDSQGCDVKFHLSYQEPGVGVITLGSWQEVYDGLTKRVIIDLSGLAGKKVQFILSVTNHGKASAANAFWLVPSIRNLPPTAAPTATPTPTATPSLTPTSNPYP